MKNKVTTIGLVRHAVTLWNEQKKIQGRNDTPLTAKGREMAEAWGRELKPLQWDEIITSDLGRAVETAEIINNHLKLPMSRDHRLGEQDWGDWTGSTLKELNEAEPNLLQREVEKGWLFQPPQGETRQHVLQRVITAVTETARLRPGKRLLIICHEGVIKCIIHHLAGRRFLPGEVKLIRPYHLHLLTVNQGRLSLKAVNHLPLHR